MISALKLNVVKTSTLYCSHSLPNKAIADVSSDMKTVIMAGIDIDASSAPLK